MEDLALRKRVLLLVAVGAATLAGAGGSASATTSQLQALIAQRQQLQAQYLKLVGTKRYDLDRLLAVEDQVKDIRRHLDANAKTLADLQAKETLLQSHIDALEAKQAADREAAAVVARGQYKSMDQNQLPEIVFGSSTLGQVVNRIVDADAVSARARALALQLKADEASLNSQQASLTAASAQAEKVQATLVAERGQLEAAMADYQSRLSGIDAETRDLLNRIDDINQAIVAAGGGPPGGIHYTREQIITIIHTAAARYGQNGDYMTRVANCESSLNPYAYDRASGASGLFQFMPGTFYAHGGHNIWDPADQSNVAAKMFSQGYSYEWTCA